MNVSGSKPRSATAPCWRVLVADANLVSRLTLCGMLAYEGHFPLGVSTVTEAIATCRDHSPELAIVAAKLGGGELARALKRLQPNLPVILVQHEMERSELGDLSQVDLVLGEPIVHVTLAHALQQVSTTARGTSRAQTTA